jgi:hypothetical protein
VTVENRDNKEKLEYRVYRETLAQGVKQVKLENKGKREILVHRESRV